MNQRRARHASEYREGNTWSIAICGHVDSGQEHHHWSFAVRIGWYITEWKRGVTITRTTKEFFHRQLALHHHRRTRAQGFHQEHDHWHVPG